MSILKYQLKMTAFLFSITHINASTYTQIFVTHVHMYVRTQRSIFKQYHRIVLKLFIKNKLFQIYSISRRIFCDQHSSVSNKNISETLKLLFLSFFIHNLMLFSNLYNPMFYSINDSPHHSVHKSIKVK